MNTAFSNQTVFGLCNNSNVKCAEFSESYLKKTLMW